MSDINSKFMQDAVKALYDGAELTSGQEKAVQAMFREFSPGGLGWHYAAPTEINAFYTFLTKYLKPENIWFYQTFIGAELHWLRKANENTSITGVPRNEKAVPLLDQVFKGEANIVHEDPLAPVVAEQEKFDLVIFHKVIDSSRKKAAAPAHLKDFRSLNRDELIWINSLARLSAAGTLVGIAPPNFFYRRKEAFFSALKAQKCRIRAAIHIPERLSVLGLDGCYILVADRQPQGKVFIGELSDQSKHKDSLLKNFQRHKGGPKVSLGRPVDLKDFRGFEQELAKDRLRRSREGIAYQAVPLRELIIVERKVSKEDALHASGEELPNTIYFRRAKNDFVLSLSEIPARKRKNNALVRALTLDERKVNADYFVNWSRTPIGQHSLHTIIGKSIASGIPLEMPCYLPPVAEQDGVVDIRRRLLNIQNEAAELEADLWDGRVSVTDLQERSEHINVSNQDQYKHWLDSLPYPIASILWRHKNMGPDRYYEKFCLLLRFFEATAAFLATIHLSAFKFSQNTNDWKKLKTSLESKNGLRFNSLKSPTFATWRVIIEYASSRVREALKERADDIKQDSISDRSDLDPMEIYGTSNQRWLERLCDVQVTTILQKVNSIRNEKDAHHTVRGAEESKKINDELIKYVEELRSIWGQRWRDYELILPVEHGKKEGEMSVHRVMGVNPRFTEDVRVFDEKPELQKLCILSAHEPKALKLLPLLRFVAPFDSTEQACYFYARQERGGQSKFISHHFEDRDEIYEDFKDTRELIEELNGIGFKEAEPKR